MIKVYLFLFIVGILGSAGYGGYSYYLWSQETMNTLRENNVKLEQVTVAQANTITELENNAAKNEELNKNLSTALQKSQVHLDALRNKFSKIDLTMEAITNPNGLEERVDNAVAKLIKRIENETSPDRNSTNAADSVSGK
jgi:Tfp pilus assembly protein PilE